MSKNVPTGWKLVPVKPTPIMLLAARRALKNYLDTLPKDELARLKRRKNGGAHVPTDLKHELRYRAMVAAAPVKGNE